MVCSKIFSGDLPEITSEIIQYFRDDFSTLLSCILVNRLWCRLTIPLLWENPFSLKYPKNHRYIEIYLHNLNENDKIQLNDYGINNDLFPLNTLFNYPSFIRYFDTHEIHYSLEKWVATVKKNKQPIDDTQNLVLIKLIYKSLIIIFIENEVNLHTFKVDYHCKYFDIISELVLQNPNFICNIRTLNLDFYEHDLKIVLTSFLDFLSSNCNSISSLSFLFSIYSHEKIVKKLSNIIYSQQNLKKITFNLNTLPLFHSFSSLKNPNYTSTLETIIFYNIDFENIIFSHEIFEKFNVLESIHVLYCLSLDSNFIQQMINLTKPFKLKSLFMDFLFEPMRSARLLLQKSGYYLENLGINLRYDLCSQEVFELITKCNIKIKFLEFHDFDDQTIYKIFQLIEKVELSLNYLTIMCHEDDPGIEELGSIILQTLGTILPSKLEYLNLILVFNMDDFEIFLKNSQNIFIKKLLIKSIKHGFREGQEKMNILPSIKKYIMKKRRVKYLACQDYFHFETEFIDDDQLISFEDEVKEFRSHNIIIRDYDDLFIDNFEFINKMY